MLYNLSIVFSYANILSKGLKLVLIDRMQNYVIIKAKLFCHFEWAKVLITVVVTVVLTWQTM